MTPLVMTGLVPAIRAFNLCNPGAPWMAGAGPAMTGAEPFGRPSTSSTPLKAAVA
jgi:hypothetical protein